MLIFVIRLLGQSSLNTASSFCFLCNTILGKDRISNDFSKCFPINYKANYSVCSCDKFSFFCPVRSGYSRTAPYSAGSGQAPLALSDSLYKTNLARPSAYIAC